MNNGMTVIICIDGSLNFCTTCFYVNFYAFFSCGWAFAVCLPVEVSCVRSHSGRHQNLLRVDRSYRQYQHCISGICLFRLLNCSLNHQKLVCFFSKIVVSTVLCAPVFHDHQEPFAFFTTPSGLCL